jgi:UrcA family protein
MFKFVLISLGAAIALATSATHAVARPPAPAAHSSSDSVDPATQLEVSYADLNLAVVQDQKILNHRIARTAESLCFHLNGSEDPSGCTAEAVQSTNDQVAAAIGRAQRQMAGLPVGPAAAISMVIGIH